MSLSIGIVGLPNVGKSTLFNALLKRQAALAANYPFATIEPNVGVVDVPDSRLEKLVNVVKNEYSRSYQNSDRSLPEKIIPAVVKFYDIAGLVKGASHGEGLGNKFLTHIRDVDAIVHVVRDFNDANVIRAGSINPKEDIETINTELMLSDLQVLEKRLPKIESDLKKSKIPQEIKKYELIKQIQVSLSRGELPNNLTSDEHALIKDFNLISTKPILYLFNVSEDNMNTGITHAAVEHSKDGFYLCAKVESEICSLNEDDQNTYMKELGITESGLDRLIRLGYGVLGLQTFFTAGPKEVRAWTIKKGAKAPEAAGTIHTDFEKGFISAEIVSFSDLIAANSWKVAKDKGLIRIEGKNYTMQDGDIVEFRFNT